VPGSSLHMRAPHRLMVRSQAVGEPSRRGGEPAHMGTPGSLPIGPADFDNRWGFHP